MVAADGGGELADLLFPVALQPLVLHSNDTKKDAIDLIGAVLAERTAEQRHSTLAAIANHDYVVGIFPNDAAITRLVGALLLEQSDEWTLQRRYMQLEGLQALADNQTARLSAVVN
jgi:hypothetical protein